MVCVAVQDPRIDLSYNVCLNIAIVAAEISKWASNIIGSVDRTMLSSPRDVGRRY